MKTLFVLYDSRCAFCRSCRRWLEAQPAFVELRFFAAHAPETECRFPGIEKLVATNELTVVSDEGAVYQGPNAFIVCLYALVEFREWSVRLARPELLPFARQFFDFISHHRSTFSRWMGDRSDEDLAVAMRSGPSPRCDNATLDCIAAVNRRASD